MVLGAQPAPWFLAPIEQNMRALQVLVYIVLQLLLLPVAVLGILPAIYKEMVVSRRLGASFTAGQVVQSHWIMHYFRTRSDETTVSLIKHLQIESHWGLMLTMSATLLANRLTGFSIGPAQRLGRENTGMTTFLPERIYENDRLAARHFAQVHQVVLLGAGFDLRMIKLARDAPDIKVFELDMPATQKVKRDAMAGAGIHESGVTFVPVDFRSEDWVEKLTDAGFDPAQTTYFHWESVNCYLEEAVVRSTLDAINRLSAPGSVLIHDYYSRALVEGEIPAFKRAGDLVARMGEPWTFGLDMSGDVRATVTAFLEESGFAVGELLPFGSKDADTPPFHLIVEARRV